MLGLIEAPLFKRFVRPISMTKLRESGVLFKNFPYALFATDVKFQPCCRPTGLFPEQKRYFSGKHKMYGLKLECSVSPTGEAVYLSKHYTGSTSDLTICIDNLSTHRALLEKDAANQDEQDFGEGSSQYRTSWAMIVDKGYQGLSEHVRSIQPKKTPRNGELTTEDLSRNARVSSDRVLVENFFGRVCSLWKVNELSSYV